VVRTDLTRASFDLLRLPLIGSLLRWRHARTLLQIPVFAVSIVMILHGFFGPTFAPRNIATTLTWVHFRGVLVFVLLFAGNFFCLACPFMLVRNAARKFFHPVRNWPRLLRTKWLAVGLLIGTLFFYEWFDLWASPWWTASLIVGYFAAALVIDSTFKHATFCKFVCPIGQFNFIASTASPLEVAVRDHDVCAACRTKDCIRGVREPAAPLVVIQRGCELALFQPRKVGNVDCTFCLDCVQACPHDNVGVIGRLPAAELVSDPLRSGLGVFSKRKDLAALVIVFTCGALLNAFGMVSPIYALENWLARLLGVSYELPVLAIVFGLFLVCEPLLLIGVAAWIARAWGRSRRSLLSLALRYSYSLAPLGFGIWLAHFSFHFLTGFYTIVPVTQAALVELGWAVLGQPQWGAPGISPAVVQLLEYAFIALGLLGSLLVSYSIATTEEIHPTRVFVPWAVLSLLLAGAAFWLMSQPMEMRGVVLGG
jgi:NAD-dependent dihydropyrimidine dehydrogenase PreA subunit